MEKQKEKSVGKFLPEMDHLIVNINNFEPLENKHEGMILVGGENIFKGYLDKNIESPFVLINNKNYYKTGDLGYIDDDGFLFITGRLKRFVKIAGEMISLPAIESILLGKYGVDDKIILAIEGKDNIIVLFSSIEIDLNEANSLIKSQGFSNLVKINRIVIVEEIPLLGTGKTDYKILKNMIL